MPAPRRPHRVAVTLEQCWHEVPGGTATSALESIRALQQHTDLDLVGVSAHHGAPPPAPFVPSIPVCQFSFPRPLLYEWWHRVRVPKVQRATGPVDVIHVTGMAMPPKSAPMVVTVHDLAFIDDPDHFTPRGVRFFHRAIELAARDADIVVCPSQATIDDCLTYGFAADRLRLVPWGTDAAPVTDDEIARVRADYALGRPYVFWTGTIEPRKNLSVLLDAFARLERTDVELVLGGPRGWNDELESLEARAPDRVRRIGFVPTRDLAALYAGAALFCFPSLREGFGLPVLEAMAQGVPVVTSAGTATAEVLDGHPAADRRAGAVPAGVLVDPRDPAAVAAAMDALLADPDRAAAIGRAGAERAATYTWARTAGGLLDAYTEAFGR